MRRWISLGWIAAVLLVLPGPALAQPGAGAGEAPGERIYEDFCASCHGRYGRGEGPLAPSLQVKPPDFTDPAWRAGRSDEALLEAITGGAHAATMAVGRVFPEDVLRNAVQYIGSLSVPGQDVSLKQGRDLYNASCWVCHGREGQGDGPAAANRPGPKPRDFTSPEFVIEGREEEVARVIRMGAEAAFHGSPMMIAWGPRLTEQQIEDLVAYLKTFKQE